VHDNVCKGTIHAYESKKTIGRWTHFTFSLLYSNGNDNGNNNINCEWIHFTGLVIKDQEGSMQWRTQKLAKARAEATINSNSKLVTYKKMYGKTTLS
jgi:hypothetical protein